MPDFKCKCTPGEIREVSVCTLKFVEGHGWINDVVCEKCLNFMELANPKVGQCAQFTSNKYGQL